MEPLTANDPQMIGEFRLHARLGAGGMGQVYLGFSPAGRPVAIKVIHSHYAADPEFLRRFSHEVTAARAVGGMYTAPVVDSSVTDSTPWLATAYVPGPSLAAIISRCGPLPEPAVWRLGAGLAEALRAVHSAAVVHRDLKPANVLLADDGPHLIDFGISRPFQGTQLTSAGMVIGTPGYMSPEQAQAQTAGPPGDVFSLGCVLAYAATGTPPFDGGNPSNPASVLFRIVSAEPDLSAVPPALRSVIEACLKKDPAQRPTPAQLIALINARGPAMVATLGSFWPEEVARAIAGEQVSSTPAGLTPPVSGWPAPPAPERVPTALATPAPGPVPSGQFSGSAPAPSPVVGATGHAPMLSDGYYAAAAQGRPTAPAPPSSSTYPQQYGAQPPSGPGTYGQAPASFGMQAPAPASQYPGPPSYPGPQQGGAPSWPTGGTPSGAGDPLAQYTPARRKPTTAELPESVRIAIRLMYLGFAVTALDAIFSLVALGQYGQDVKNTKAALSVEVLQRRIDADNAALRTQDHLVGVMTMAVAADLIGLVCWAVLAMAARRGHAWTRVAGTVLLGAYSICTLIVLFASNHDISVQFTTAVVWAIGLATVIPMWSHQARDFFLTWRKS